MTRRTPFRQITEKGLVEQLEKDELQMTNTVMDTEEMRGISIAEIVREVQQVRGKMQGPSSSSAQNESSKGNSSSKSRQEQQQEAQQRGGGKGAGKGEGGEGAKGGMPPPATRQPRAPEPSRRDEGVSNAEGRRGDRHGGRTGEESFAVLSQTGAEYGGTAAQSQETGEGDVVLLRMRGDVRQDYIYLPLSNMSKGHFYSQQVEGVVNSSESLLQAYKVAWALEKGDAKGKAKVTKVLAEESPFEARNLGGPEGVLGRMNDTQLRAWGGGLDARAAKLATYEKFRSLEKERRMLVETGGKRIIEVSRDRRWGSGCSISELQKTDYGMNGQMRGSNLQGKTLEWARYGLQQMAEDRRAEFDMFDKWAISGGGVRNGAAVWYGPVTQATARSLFETSLNFRTRGRWRPLVHGLSDKMDEWLGRNPLIGSSDEEFRAFIKGKPGENSN